MTRWFILILMIALLCFGITAQDENSAPDNLIIAWAVNGDLFLWRSGDASPTSIAHENVLQPYLAPDGQTIAFTRGTDGFLMELWLIDSDGSNERQIDAPPPIINQIIWQDAQTLYFNTSETTAVGFDPRDDLYRFILTDNTLEEIQPGGNVSVSPDSNRLIILTPGEYNGQPGTIRVTDTSGTEQITLLEFPSVATAAHYRFYPEIQWQDNDIFYAALPQPDTIYNELNIATPPEVALWSFDLTTNTAEEIVRVNASFFGLPVRSPQTGEIAYLTRSGESNQFVLMVTQSDGAQPEPYITADAGTILNPQWLPDGERFIYAHDGAYWIGQRGAEPIQWLEINPIAMVAPTILSEGILYILLNADSQQELRYAAFNAAETDVITIAVLDTLPVFDDVEIDG